MTAARDCLLCEIAGGALERSTVHEDEEFVIVMDLMPVNRGHALVVPRRHAELIGQLEPSERAAMMELAARTGAALRASDLPCEGVNLWIADGQAAGQEVPHVHLHVLPRFGGDRFRLVMEGGWTEPQPHALLDEDAARLRAVWA